MMYDVLCTMHNVLSLTHKHIQSPVPDPRLPNSCAPLLKTSGSSATDLPTASRNWQAESRCSSHTTEDSDVPRRHMSSELRGRAHEGPALRRKRETRASLMDMKRLASACPLTGIHRIINQSHRDSQVKLNSTVYDRDH